MSFSTKHTLVDLGKKSIPQHFNQDIDDYEATNGVFGGASSHVLGTIFVDKLEGSTTQTKSLAKQCIGLYVKNDGDGDIRITVGENETPIIKGGEPFNMCFEPFSSITVTVLSATSYRIVIAR